MYLGIDLGTSNSAIVGNLNSELKLYKTADQSDVLPSVIHIDKRGHKFVGKRAYDQAILSPDNVAQGFKRLMGTSTPIAFAAAGLTMTPEEASAEVIRTLLTQAYTEAGKTDIAGTVVTIPAAFNQMQSEATIRAATAAGLDAVGLLQEPIAAAMASMAQAKTKSGQFLVYDLGGGTFDLALVQSVGGAVNILAHEGINALGGRDFDLAIVNAVVRLWLYEKFDLPENMQADPRYRRLIGMARLRAEQAKIELSSKESAMIFVGDEEARTQDQAGDDIYIEAELTRRQLDELIAPRIEETMALCRKILKDNGYSHEDIDRIVLIGGPTKMPGIRSRIPQELGIPVDLQTDPMTAVAFGAAIFAESRDWSQGATKRKATRASAATSGPVEIRYDYAARSSDDRAIVKVKSAAAVAAKGYELQVDSLAGWSSGRRPVATDLTIEVPLAERGDNRFRIMVFDPQGAPVAAASTEITITRTHASAAGIPATQTIAAAVVDEAGAEARNILEPLIEKGTLLPATGTKRFRAARDLKAGSETHIDLELYQQAPGVPEPELNLRIGNFRIAGTDLSPGMTIRKHDEIIVHWAMNDSGLLNASIEIPSVEQTFDTGRFYSDTAGHQNFDGADGGQLASSVIDNAQNELDAAADALTGQGQKAVGKLQEELATQRQTLDQTQDPDTRRSVAESARHVRQALSRLRHAPEHRAAVLGQRLTEIRQVFDNVLREVAGPETVAQFDRLAETAEQGLRRGNAHGFDEAERALAEMATVQGRELWRQPAFILRAFKSLAEERFLAIDKDLHDNLVSRGEARIAANDVDGLMQVVREIHANRFQIDGGDRELTRFAGLMRA
jgi:molecular chaperone DnaK